MMFDMSKIGEGRRYKLLDGRIVTVIKKMGRGRNRDIETEPALGPVNSATCRRSPWIHVRALAYKIGGELIAGSPCCQHCGEEFPRVMLVNGQEIPTHDFPRPCRSVCPGSHKLPRVDGERLGKDLF